MKQKYCEGCKDYHPVKEFNKRLDGADGLATYCRSYVNKKENNRYYKKKAEKAFDNQFMPI